MAASLGASQLKVSSVWEFMKKKGSGKGAAVQTGLQPGSRGLASVGSRYQAKTSKDTAVCKRLRVCDTDLYSMKISDGAIIGCSYELCVKVINKSNIQSKTPSRVTHTT
jgi:hypothetical protein